MDQEPCLGLPTRRAFETANKDTIKEKRLNSLYGSTSKWRISNGKLAQKAITGELRQIKDFTGGKPRVPFNFILHSPLFSAFARRSRATFESKLYLVLHTKLERFSINSRKPKPKVITEPISFWRKYSFQPITKQTNSELDFSSQSEHKAAQVAGAKRGKQ